MIDNVFNIAELEKTNDGWLFGKLKFFLSIPITDGPHETPVLYEKGIPFVSAEAVSAGNGRIDLNHIRGYISEEYYLECCKKYIPQINDIYMIKSGATTGGLAIVDTDTIFTIWSPLAVIRANTEILNPYYLFYFLKGYVYQKQVEVMWNFGTQQNIGMQLIENLKIMVPPLNIQKSIVSYLDNRCSKIDGAIAQRKAIIEKLKEYKSAVITKAVTKGLNPDAEMKDSGIDWIGKIPKHWEYKRLKFLLKTNVNDLKIGPFGSALKGKTLPKDKGEYCIYAQANLIENTFETTKHYVDAETFNELNSYEIYPDDMLFSMMGTIGKCKAMPYGFTKGIMDSHLLKARFSEEQIYAPYFEYFYDKDNSYAAILQLNKMAVGSIMSGLNCNILKNVMVTVPPMSEQKAIVAYLDSQCAKIDEAIEKQEQAVAKLEEYRKSIIYHAVTGKIDCRDI